MPHTRRIAQGLLVAFTISTVLPPMPAWALRQRSGSEVATTQTGLEEGLTGKPTTMNRRQFLTVGATAVGGAVGATAAEAFLPTAVAPEGTAILQPGVLPVLVPGSSTDLSQKELLSPDRAVRMQFEGSMALRSRGKAQADGTIASPRQPRPSTSLSAPVYAEGVSAFELTLALIHDGGGAVAGPGEAATYPSFARGTPVSVVLKIQDLEGIDSLAIGDWKYAPARLAQGVEIPLGQFKRANDIRIPIRVWYAEHQDPQKTRTAFAFTASPGLYTFQVRPVDAGRAAAIGASALTVGVVAGGVALAAAAKAEKTTAGLEEGLTGSPVAMDRRHFLKQAATLVSAVSASALDQPRLSIQKSSASPRLTIAGAPSTTYRVETRDDVTTPWAPIAWVTTDPSGNAAWDDARSPSRQRFYRLVTGLPAMLTLGGGDFSPNPVRETDDLVITVAVGNTGTAGGVLRLFLIFFGRGTHYYYSPPITITPGSDTYRVVVPANDRQREGRITPGPWRVTISAFDITGLAAGAPNDAGKRLETHPNNFLTVTPAGLEEDARTTMNRREFMRTLGLKIAPAAAVGAVMGRMSAAPLTTPSRDSSSPLGMKPPIVTSRMGQGLINTGATIAGALVVGGAAATVFSPADAEKVLAEYIDATVSAVKDIASKGQSLILLVDSEVADSGAVRQMRDAIRDFYGYPVIIVDDLTGEEQYRRALNVHSQHIIRLVAKPDALVNVPMRDDTIYVGGLNGQRVGDMLPALATEAVALWWREHSALGHLPLVFDAAPYLTLRDLTGEQVRRVLYGRFA